MEYLKEAVLESRRLVNGLRSLALDDLGLAGAIEQLLHEEKQRAGWTDARWIHNVEGRRFDRGIETAVYRVAQEALTNVRKHAESQQARVMLIYECSGRPGEGQLTLEVRDWGHGFEPEKRIGMKGHVGLQGMMERVSLIGGTCQVTSALGRGSTIHCAFPVIDPGALTELTDSGP
jgi:signal transduction histidine kinase